MTVIKPHDIRALSYELGGRYGNEKCEEGVQVSVLRVLNQMQ